MTSNSQFADFISLNIFRYLCSYQNGIETRKPQSGNRRKAAAAAEVPGETNEARARAGAASYHKSIATCRY